MTFARYSISPPFTSLPFGAGKPYLSSPGIARTIFGGWTLSAIGTAQTGLPFNITIDRSNGSVPGDYAISGEERPNYVYWRPAYSARRIHAGRMGQPGRVFHARSRDVRQSGPQRLSRSRHFGTGSRVGEGCLLCRTREACAFGPTCSTFSIALSMALPMQTYPKSTSA